MIKITSKAAWLHLLLFVKIYVTNAKILRDEVYIGNLMQGKTQHISYKNNKSVKVPKENWIVVENTHEPIITIEWAI